MDSTRLGVAFVLAFLATTAAFVLPAAGRPATAGLVLVFAGRTVTGAALPVLVRMSGKGRLGPGGTSVAAFSEPTNSNRVAATATKASAWSGAARPTLHAPR